jgi:hypothetical protein
LRDKEQRNTHRYLLFLFPSENISFFISARQNKGAKQTNEVDNNAALKNVTK